MSSMDTGNTLRSQEFVQRSEMQSQSLRQDSANQMVGGLRQTVEAAKQFAILDAEAKARLQMHEQEMQINAVKLQHMQALDATDLMGEQVEAARLQNKAQRLAIQEQEQRAETWKKMGMSDVEATLRVKAMEYGMEPGEGGFKAMDPKKIEAIREAQSRLNAARNAPSYTDLRREFEAVQYTDPKRAAELQQMMDDLKAKAGMPMATSPPKKPPAPAPDPLDAKTEADLAPWMHALNTTFTTDPVKQKAIITGLWARRAKLKEIADQARTDNHPQPFTEREAFDIFMQALVNPNDPRHDMAVRMMQIAAPSIVEKR